MDPHKSILKFYMRAEKAIAPTLRYSQSIYEDLLDQYADKGKSWLDLGCGRHLLPPWRLQQEKILASRPHLLVGLDRDDASLRDHLTIHHRICGDILELPFRSRSFDLITSNMVFEHLMDPEKQLAEIFRILKPDGYLIFHTPNALGYITLFSRVVPDSFKKLMIRFLEGRADEDVFPTYYRINTPYRIRKMAERSGFQIARIRLILSLCQFSKVPPLALIELIWIRLLMTRYGKPLRSNILVVLRKPSE